MPLLMYLRRSPGVPKGAGDSMTLSEFLWDCPLFALEKAQKNQHRERRWGLAAHGERAPPFFISFVWYRESLAEILQLNGGGDNRTSSTHARERGVAPNLFTS